MIMILLLTALSTALVASFLRKFWRICPDCTLISDLREIEVKMKILPSFAQTITRY